MLIGSEYDRAQMAIYMFNKYTTCNNNKHTNKNTRTKLQQLYHPYMFNLQASYFNKSYLHDIGACCILKIKIQLFLKRICSHAGQPPNDMHNSLYIYM